MAVRRCKKQDLKRIAKATGAQFVTSLANMEGEEEPPLGRPDALWLETTLRMAMGQREKLFCP